MVDQQPRCRCRPRGSCCVLACPSHVLAEEEVGWRRRLDRSGPDRDPTQSHQRRHDGDKESGSGTLHWTGPPQGSCWTLHAQVRPVRARMPPSVSLPATDVGPPLTRRYQGSSSEPSPGGRCGALGTAYDCTEPHRHRPFVDLTVALQTVRQRAVSFRATGVRTGRRADPFGRPGVAGRASPCVRGWASRGPGGRRRRRTSPDRPIDRGTGGRGCSRPRPRARARCGPCRPACRRPRR